MTHRKRYHRTRAAGCDGRRYDDHDRYYGDYDPSPGLARDPIRGRLGGVCAGIARCFGWRTSIVRLVTIVGLFIVPHIIIIGYILLYAVLDERV